VIWYSAKTVHPIHLGSLHAILADLFGQLAINIKPLSACYRNREEEN